MAISECGEPCRETISSVITGRIEALAMRIDRLNTRIYSQLDPVMMPEPPACTTSDKINGPVEDIFPPYFDRLRNFCRGIERNIDSIEDALRRTEL